jgi:hypothetical protein
MSHNSETSLSPRESKDLRTIAGIMIPASAEYAIPAADDPAIFDDIQRSLGRDLDSVRSALRELAELAGGSFAELEEPRRESVANAFLSSGTPDVTVLGRAILQCYYRDDRVMRSLGLEPRPPFPKGHTLEQGDWSLLDPVRNRPKMWRDAP